jgi:malonate-semialdehyde dehydrogenase (acetylating) / methylmalonate-semialdehyde dehydrogenase
MSSTVSTLIRNLVGEEWREASDPAGMTGINVPVAQPFAFFPFSGWKGSFYGDLHVHGTDGIDFYTRKKVVVTRW